MFKLDLEKAEEPEIKFPTSTGSSKKQESSRKASTSAKAFECVDHNKLWKILKEMGQYQTTLPASWEICMQAKKQQLELDIVLTDWFQIGKGVHQGCILSSCLFKLYAEYIMRNAKLDEAQSGIKIAKRNINILRYADDTPLWQKVKRN